MQLTPTQRQLTPSQQFAFERSGAEAEVEAHSLGRQPGEVHSCFECSGNREVDGGQRRQLRGQPGKDPGFDRAHLHSQIERLAGEQVAIPRAELRCRGADCERDR